MSMTEREARMERVYARLTAEEQKLVDRWDTFETEDRTALWTTISLAARQFVYMMTDGRPGLM